MGFNDAFVILGWKVKHFIRKLLIPAGQGWVFFTTTSLSVAVSLLTGEDSHDISLLPRGQCIYQMEVDVCPKGHRQHRGFIPFLQGTTAGFLAISSLLFLFLPL